MQHYILYPVEPPQRPISWCTPEVQWFERCLGTRWTIQLAVKGSIPHREVWRPRSRQHREELQPSHEHKGAMNNELTNNENEQFWKSILEKEALHNTDGLWLVDLRADHSNLPELEQMTITMVDNQERVPSMWDWNALSPDVRQTCWVKKLTSLHQRLAAHKVVNPRLDNPLH